MNNVERDIRELERRVDALEKGISLANKGIPENQEGVPGEIRIIKLDNGEFALQVKSEDGWLTSTSAAFTFRKRGEMST